MKSTEDKIAPKGRAPFTVTRIHAILVNVDCPECRCRSTKIILRDEMNQVDEKALCPCCHKWRAINIESVKEELRTLLQ